MKKSLLTTLFGIGITAGTFAQNVTIPDANFKAYLVADPNINTNADSEIQVSEATAFSTSINCNFLNISDFTGLEAFVNLHSLTIVYNPVTTLDLSQNTALTVLDVYNNDLTSLNVSNNTQLVELRCENNPLETLDVSMLPALSMLTCGNCSLSTLDVTNNTQLVHFEPANYNSPDPNELTTIDLSNNTLLEIFGVAGNLLTSLDLSNNDAITWINCYNNDITSLDLSNLTNLVTIYASRNALTSIDISNNMSLEAMDVSNNPLVGNIDISNHVAMRSIWCEATSISGLNLANGHNSEFGAMYASQNPNLTCIEVDDEIWSTTNWGQQYNKDTIASYSEDCDGLGIIEAQQLVLNVYPNPATNVLNIELNSAATIQIVNIMGEIIQQYVLAEGTNSIAIENLNAGTYFIQTQNGSKAMFVKQ